MSCWLLACVAKFAYSEQLSTETNSQSAWACRLCIPRVKPASLWGMFWKYREKPHLELLQEAFSVLLPKSIISKARYICSRNLFCEPWSRMSAHFHGDSSYQLLKELACIVNKPLLAIGLFSFSISSSICSKALLQKEIGCRCVLFLSLLPSPFLSLKEVDPRD